MGLEHEFVEDDEELQSGLGRGLDSILGRPDASSPSASSPGAVAPEPRGIEALFGTAPRPPMPLAAVPSPTDRPPSPPLPETVARQLDQLAHALGLDVAAHAGLGRSGTQLRVHRPSAHAVPAVVMDELCAAIRAFVAEERLADDFSTTDFRCVVLGRRPLDAAGAFVLGRRRSPLDANERWEALRLLGRVADAGRGRPL